MVTKQTDGCWTVLSDTLILQRFVAILQHPRGPKSTVFEMYTAEAIRGQDPQVGARAAPPGIRIRASTGWRSSGDGVDRRGVAVVAAGPPRWDLLGKPHLSLYAGHGWQVGGLT